MAVVLGEDEGLGNLGAAREDLGEEPLLERADHEPDLVFGDHVPVELVGGVGQVVVEFGVALGAGAAVPMGDEPARLALQGRPLLGDPGPDAVDVEADVHAIGHGLLVAVFHHEVAVEEADGLGGRRGGQPDQEGVEVVEHLPPEVVDGAVALIDDDEVERLDGDVLVVDDRQRLLDQAGRQLEQRLLVGLLVELFLALEDRVEALDRRDARPCSSGRWCSS